MAGRFGYELDVTRLDEKQEVTIKRQIEFEKSIRELVAFGSQYRLVESDSGTYFAWMYVSEDCAKAVVTIVSKTIVPVESKKRIYLKGLDENAVYACGDERYSGRVLMNMGLEYTHRSNYACQMLVFERV